MKLWERWLKWAPKWAAFIPEMWSAWGWLSVVAAPANHANRMLSSTATSAFGPITMFTRTGNLLRADLLPPWLLTKSKLYLFLCIFYHVAFDLIHIYIAYCLHDKIICWRISNFDLEIIHMSYDLQTKVYMKLSSSYLLPWIFFPPFLPSLIRSCSFE